MIFIHQVPMKEVVGCIAEGFVTPPDRLGPSEDTFLQTVKYNEFIKLCRDDIDEMIEEMDHGLSGYMNEAYPFLAIESLLG